MVWRPQKGFVLVEFLIAVLIFSVAGTMLFFSLGQGLKAVQKIRKGFEWYDPYQMLFVRLERDLRNTVALKDYPFEGGPDELRFPVLTVGRDRFGRRENKILSIHYFISGHNLVRGEQELTAQLKKAKERKKIVFRNFKTLEWEFPYEDLDRRHEFRKDWVKEPYYGIPRSLKLIISDAGLKLEKLVFIPQGKFAYPPEERQPSHAAA